MMHASKHVGVFTIYKILLIYMLCVGLDNKLSKMHGTYIKIKKIYGDLLVHRSSDFNTKTSNVLSKQVGRAATDFPLCPFTDSTILDMDLAHLFCPNRWVEQPQTFHCVPSQTALS